MKIIFGLGNPGMRYLATRHNCGFLTLDQLAQELGMDFGRKTLDNQVASGTYQGEKLILAKPQSYMNLSGHPVKRLMNFYKVDLQEILVVHDDLDLPPGVLRLRRQGSDGGHNGMKSIIEQLGTMEINRLKIGIGASIYDTADYVLSNFPEEDKPLFAESFRRAAEAVLCWTKQGMGEAMNKFNHPPQE